MKQTNRRKKLAKKTYKNSGTKTFESLNSKDVKELRAEVYEGMTDDLKSKIKAVEQVATATHKGMLKAKLPLIEGSHEPGEQIALLYCVSYISSFYLGEADYNATFYVKKWWLTFQAYMCKLNKVDLQGLFTPKDYFI